LARGLATLNFESTLGEEPDNVSVVEGERAELLALGLR
jgi:hypothetical protein